jgi:hypothetical protein
LNLKVTTVYFQMTPLPNSAQEKVTFSVSASAREQFGGADMLAALSRRSRKVWGVLARFARSGAFNSALARGFFDMPVWRKRAEQKRFRAKDGGAEGIRTLSTFANFHPKTAVS